MSIVHEIAANAAATSWTDITSIVDRLTAKVGGQGSRCQVGTGSGIDVDDNAGTIYLPGRRVYRVTETATTPDTILFRGRLSQKGLGRGFRHDGDTKRIGAQLDDYNQDLWGIIVDGQHRPVEWDYERVRWLINKYLSGTASTSIRARDSTNLTDTWVSEDDPVRLPAEDYSDTTPAQILMDIIGVTGKECFVTVDGEIFYDDPLSTAYAADISISDQAPEGSNDIYAPDWSDGDAATEDPVELLSGIKAKYGEGEHTSVSLSDDAIVAAHDKWEEIHRLQAKTLAKATSQAQTIMEQHGIEEKRRTCALTLTAENVDRIKWGQTISFEASAAADLTPVTLRIARLIWDLPPVDGSKYVAHLELVLPQRIGARISPGAGTTPPADPGPFTPEQTQIAGQAILHTIDAPMQYDRTWNYPGGSPAGRLRTGYQYKLAIDILTNRYVDADWGYTQANGAEAYLLDSADYILSPGGETAIGGWSDPVGPGLDDDAGKIIIDPYAAEPGTHGETSWWTYTGADMDFDFGMSGVPASGFYGHETTWRITLYVRAVSGAPIVGETSPSYGQQVVGDQDLGGGDGVTKTGVTAFPYLPGSLHIRVNGFDWTPWVTEVDPASGAYELEYAPPPGATIERTYQAASGTSTGSGGEPPVAPGTDPDPVTTLPAAGSGANEGAGALQALIDAAAAGSILTVPFRTWHETITINKALDLRMSGGTIDADAIRSHWVRVTADNVSISDCWMIDAAPATASAQKTPQEGSLECLGRSNLRLFNVHTRTGLDCNLRLQNSPNAQIIGSSFNEAPRAGATLGNNANLVMRDSKFNDNHTDATYNALWEGGGYKIGGSGATNVVIERVECSGNIGSVGHWIDEHPSNVTIRDCWGDHNGFSGLMIEIAHGFTVVRFRSWENGWDDARGDDPSSGDWGWGAGILISSAGVVNVIDSISAWDSAGLTRINQGDRSNRESTVRLTGSGNVVAGDTGRRISSWHQDGSGNQILTTDPSNNETGLRYYTVGTPYFNWDGDVTAAAFAATRGGQGLTLLSGAATIALLDAADVGGVAGVGIPNAPEAH